jgi:hypothetical protein
MRWPFLSPTKGSILYFGDGGEFISRKSVLVRRIDLTTNETDLRFPVEVGRMGVSRSAKWSRREAVPAQEFLCPMCGSMSFSNWRDSCVAKACSLLILDKGKPVARPARKAKGRRMISGGSLAAERIVVFGKRRGRGLFLLNLGS